MQGKVRDMALPLVPVATIAAKYGAVALAGFLLARQVQRGHLDQRSEDALDRVPEGVTVHRPRDRDREQANATARINRVIRLGTDGPGVEVDFSALMRLRLRRR